MKAYRTFLSALYGSKNPDDHILIWTLPGRQSNFCKTIDEAVCNVEKKLGSHNVFFQVGTSPQNYGNYKRCLIQNVSGIPALYLDIDYSHPLHKKKELPSTIEEAIELTKFDGFSPSIIMHSGHGLQAYYLFPEFWHFNSDEDREKAAELSQRLHHTIKARAAKHGWTIDSVFDLARVLRVPGSFNRKDPEDVIETRILEQNEYRYSIADFEAGLVELSGETQPLFNGPCNEVQTGKPLSSTTEDISGVELPEEPTPAKKVTLMNNDVAVLANSLILDPSRTPTIEMFDTLYKVVGPKFAETWDNKRAFKDDTPSSYDSSLVMFAAKAGWFDQNCADLMIAHRVKNNHKLKLDNRQYYARTILSCRALIAKSEGKVPEDKKAGSEDPEKKSTTASEPTPAGSSPAPLVIENGIITDDGRRQLALQGVNAKIGVVIIKIIKYLEDPDPVYYITAEVLDQKTKTKLPKEIKLGTVAAILEGRIFRQKIAALTNQIIPMFKSAEWAKLAQQLINICIEKEISAEATDMGQIDVWLKTYIIDKDEKTIQEAEDSKDPFVHNGTWHIWKDKFFRWAKTAMNCETQQKTFMLNLRRYGCKPTTVALTINGKRTTRSVWRLPTGFTI